jgi:hypothetical protein
MSARTIKLLGPAGDVLATGQMDREGDKLTGGIDLTLMPPSMVRTFQEYETIVKGQIFSLLDEIEQRISDLTIRVAFDDGHEACIEELQIYPSTRSASFTIRAANGACR